MRIYTKPDCPYCVKAKELLTSYGFSFEEIVVGVDISAEDYKNMIPGYTSVPGIYNKNFFIGGYTELVKFLPSYPNR